MNTFLKKPVAVTIAILVVIAGVTFFVSKKGFFRSGSSSGQSAQVEKDIETLENDKASLPEKSQALMRLAIQENSEALDFIEEQIKRNNTQIVPWATRALGYFTSSEGLKILKQQLQSENPLVREAAIDALGTRNHPEKLKLLEESKAAAKSDQEKARFMIAEMRLNSNPEAREGLVKAILSELDRSTLDPAARIYLVSQVFFLNPRSPEVEKFFAKLITQVKTSDEFTMVATIRALKIYCPAQRYTIFKEALARPNLTPAAVTQTLNELIFHSGPDALAIFKASEKRLNVNPDFAENLRKQLENPQIPSPCSAKAAPAAATKTKP
ncbi:MAG: hypothetical protein RJB38_557 [Pseudomonadota bacterium]|jgi:hypothetical protein